MSDHMPNLDAYLDPDRHSPHLCEPDRDPEPTIELEINWPGESSRRWYAEWAEVFAVLDRFVHIRQSRLTVSCDDEDEDVHVCLAYKPNRSEIAFHAGPRDFVDADEVLGRR